MSIATSDHPMDPQFPFGFWGGMRGGLLTDLVLKPSPRAFYAVYPSVTTLSQAYPAPYTFTWIQNPMYSRKYSYLRWCFPVPSVWSNDVTNFYHQLGSRYPGAMDSSAFPCSWGLFPDYSYSHWDISNSCPSWGPGANQLSQACSEGPIRNPSFRRGLGWCTSYPGACQSRPQMSPHFFHHKS